MGAGTDGEMSGSERLVKGGRARKQRRRRGWWRKYVLDNVLVPTAAKARCRLVITERSAEARNEQALRALHCNGKAMGSWRGRALGNPEFWAVL